jgi:hypothetical protein
MSDKVKYIYGEQFAQKLPGSDQNFYFRTATEYKVDGNGKPIEGSAKTVLYYAPKPAARTSDGKTWTPGTADSVDNFDQGGWVIAAVTFDGGKTYSFRNYTQTDADKGRIPAGKNVGDEVLGATAQQSLSTSGGRFYEAVQNNIINLAANTQPGLAQVVSAKQTNAVQQQTPIPEPEEPVAPSRDPSIDPSVDNPTTINPSTITIGESSGRRNFGTYAYPYDLRTNTQDRIIFTLKEIKGSTITPTFERGQRVIKRNELSNIEGSVTLPIQSGITDSNSVDWSGSSLNAIQAYAAGASLTFMDSSDAGELGNNVSNILGKVAQKIKGNNDYNNALKLYLAQEAVGINGLLSRASGAILNPNLELLFNGPQLRPFNFTFRLSPREEKEATEVRSIIRFFKEAMSVRTSSDNIFLKSPLVFDIKYVTYGADGKPLKNHPSIGRIKTCALLSCDVDYTPDGSYMTFNDSARTMTSYGLSLRFSELDPIYNTDYYDSENKNNNIPTDNIGY